MATIVGKIELSQDTIVDHRAKVAAARNKRKARREANIAWVRDKINEIQRIHGCQPVRFDELSDSDLGLIVQMVQHNVFVDDINAWIQRTKEAKRRV